MTKHQLQSTGFIISFLVGLCALGLLAHHQNVGMGQRSGGMIMHVKGDMLPDECSDLTFNVHYTVWMNNAVKFREKVFIVDVELSLAEMTIGNQDYDNFNQLSSSDQAAVVQIVSELRAEDYPVVAKLLQEVGVHDFPQRMRHKSYTSAYWGRIGFILGVAVVVGCVSIAIAFGCVSIICTRRLSKGYCPICRHPLLSHKLCTECGFVTGVCSKTQPG